MMSRLSRKSVADRDLNNLSRALGEDTVRTMSKEERAPYLSFLELSGEVNEEQQEGKDNSLEEVASFSRSGDRRVNCDVNSNINSRDDMRCSVEEVKNRNRNIFDLVWEARSTKLDEFLVAARLDHDEMLAGAAYLEVVSRLERRKNCEEEMWDGLVTLMAKSRESRSRGLAHSSGGKSTWVSLVQGKEASSDSQGGKKLKRQKREETTCDTYEMTECDEDDVPFSSRCKSRQKKVYEDDSDEDFVSSLIHGKSRQKKVNEDDSDEDFVPGNVRGKVRQKKVK